MSCRLEEIAVPIENRVMVSSIRSCSLAFDGECEDWRHKANEAPGLSQSGEDQVTSENFSGSGSFQWLLEAPVRLQASQGSGCAVA